MKLDFLTWFISALACYRLTVLIARDKGPFGLCKKLRESGGEVFKCPFCISVWIGLFVSALLDVSGYISSVVMLLLVALSFSAVSIVIDRTFTSDYQN